MTVGQLETGRHVSGASRTGAAVLAYLTMSLIVVAGPGLTGGCQSDQSSSPRDMAHVASASQAPSIQSPTTDDASASPASTSQQARNEPADPPIAVAHEHDASPAHLEPGTIQAFAASSNAFALDLYGTMRETKGSFVLSPAVLAMSLATIWLGARTSTRAEMSTALRISVTSDQIAAALGSLLRKYASGIATTDIAYDPRQPRLLMANRLFAQRTYPFEKRFLDLNVNSLGTSLQPVDFRQDCEGARQSINQWVAEHTENRIADLIPPGSLEDYDRLVLASTIFLHAAWVDSFSTNETSLKPFRGTFGAARVPMMHQVARFSFASVPGLKLVEMRYLGMPLVMNILLPDQVDGLRAVERRITRASLDKWLSQLAQRRVDLSLPRFSIARGEPMRLARQLSQMGMRLLFDSRNADLTGIADFRVTGEPPLYLREVFHKANITVNEEGTEASAANGSVAGVFFSADMTNPVIFNADHPFLFLLRDSTSGLILFMGRFAGPVSASPLGLSHGDVDQE